MFNYRKTTRMYIPFVSNVLLYLKCPLNYHETLKTCLIAHYRKNTYAVKTALRVSEIKGIWSRSISVMVNEIDKACMLYI